MNEGVTGGRGPVRPRGGVPIATRLAFNLPRIHPHFACNPFPREGVVST
jgi:hypothetical protein